MIIDQYPNIRRAYLEMSYDNGGINVTRTEEDAITDSQPVMSTIAGNVSADDLQRLDAWIGTLSDDQVQTLIAGEETETAAIVALGPVSNGVESTPLSPERVGQSLDTGEHAEHQRFCGERVEGPHRNTPRGLCRKVQKS